MVNRRRSRRSAPKAARTPEKGANVASAVNVVIVAIGRAAHAVVRVVEDARASEPRYAVRGI